MHKDRITGIIAIGLGSFITFFTSQLPPSIVPGDIGAKAFPFLAAGIIMTTGTGLVLKKLPDEKSKPYFSVEEWKRFGFLLSAFIIYAVLLWATGFLIATPITMFMVSSLFSVGKNIPIWKKILFSVLVTAIIYVCFYTILGLKLPTGKFIKFMI